MKTLLLLASLAITAAAPQAPSYPSSTPAKADPAPPAQKAATEAEHADQVMGARDSAAVLKNLGAGPDQKAAANEKWGDIDDTGRYLLIMGTADGFAAAGPGSPCFPGKDNSTLDRDVKAAGMDAKSPLELAEALKKIAGPSSQCLGPALRGYDTDLIRGMTDENLALYLTGVVRGYAAVKPCPVEMHGAAAAVVAAELFGADEAQNPVSVIAPVIAKGCSKPE